MTDFLFDTPYWILGLLVLIGAALVISGNKRQEKKLMEAGVIPIALALLLGVMSFLFETDKERAIGRTKRLIQAVETKDPKTFGELLHPQANLLWMGKEDLIAAAGRAMDDYHVQKVTVSGIEATPSEGAVTIVLGTIANVETPGGTFPVSSEWKLVWIKGADKKFLLRDIQCLKLPNATDIGSVIARWKK